MAKKKSKSKPRDVILGEIAELKRSIKKSEATLYYHSANVPYRKQVALAEKIAKQKALLKTLEQSI